MANTNNRVVTSNINIENARLVFRNFRGEEQRFNPAGRRNFCVLINDDDAEMFKKDGWNVRYLAPREEEDEPQAYLQVAVSFDNRPPQVWLIAGGRKTNLDVDSINILDWAEIETVDLIIRPYNYDVNGKQGVKAYLKSMYVTIVEDEFEKKYREVPGGNSDAD